MADIPSRNIALANAVSIASSLALRKNTHDIISDAEMFEQFLSGKSKHVFVLTSMTYKMDDAPFDDNLIVGVFATREAAESYRDNAVGPVTDGKIVEWGVSDDIVLPGGRIE